MYLKMSINDTSRKQISDSIANYTMTQIEMEVGRDWIALVHMSSDQMYKQV